MTDVTEHRQIGTDGSATVRSDVTAASSHANGTLAGLAVGGRGRVRNFNCAAPLMQRLLEMGLTRGTRVELIRVAPLGDPLEIRLRGYFLSLRRAEAGLIEIDAEPRP